MSYPDEIEQTFPENWPDELKDLAAPMTDFVLSDADLQAMASVHPALRDRLQIPHDASFSDACIEQLTAALAETAGENGAFLRTSYGAFKSSPFGLSPVHTVDEALSLLRWPDGRIGQFVQNRITSKAPMALIISPWRDIAPTSEFRLFYAGGRMVGASQYHHSRVYPEMVNRKQELAAALSVITPQIGQALHMSDVVVDIELILQPGGAPIGRVIELNPYLSITDPCLFSWANGGNFDGTLRVRYP